MKTYLQHWWNVVTIAGAVITVTFFILQLTHGFLLGLGLLLFGIGERINHPMRSKMDRGRGSSVTIESDPRDPNGLGFSLDAIGIGLFMIGLFLMVMAP
jgi:hypothetical protein